jgi:hypothetical protein
VILFPQAPISVFCKKMTAGRENRTLTISDNESSALPAWLESGVQQKP